MKIRQPKKRIFLGYAISKFFYFIKNSVNTIYTEYKKIVELFERIIRNIIDNEIVKNDDPKDLDFILNFNGYVVLNKTEKTRIKSDLIPTKNNIKNESKKPVNIIKYEPIKDINDNNIIRNIEEDELNAINKEIGFIANELLKK